MLNTQSFNTRAQSDKTYHLIVSFRPGELPSTATVRAIENRVCHRLGLVSTNG
ncbi:MAG: relaxase/mobilization nuclease domain-containing protein [Nitrospira sp.]